MPSREMLMVTGRVPKELVNAVKDELYGKGNHVDASDRERAQVIAESFRHFAQCRGMSCEQGDKPCRDRCNVEMACAGDDEPTFWQRIQRWLIGN